MTASEIRKKFLDFFEQRGHTVVPSGSLVPDDPSVLLTTAGMQQFKPYYTGAIDPMTAIHPTLGRPIGARNAVSVQKSFRTSDIDEVGDESHLTFFEMLGNFSFGGYFKKEAISYVHEFITKELGLTISYVTIFEGSKDVPKDEESKKIWSELGIQDVREDTVENVFWGPTGSEGPCGPTTEIYCKNASGHDIEVWNIVFNEYFYPGSREELLSGISDKKLEKLKNPGVDTGMGFERLVMIAQKTNNIFETDIFTLLLDKLPPPMDEKIKRIFMDHMRAAVFLICDGVRPANKGAGYILRRLLRRAMVQEYLVHKNAGQYSGQHMDALTLNKALFSLRSYYFDVAKVVVDSYKTFYSNLDGELVYSVIDEERTKFAKTMKDGEREWMKLPAKIDSRLSFKMFESYGLTFEAQKDLDPVRMADVTREAFDAEFKKHQEISRAGAEKKFGGHGLLLNTGELKAADEKELAVVTQLHTATHLLHAALRSVLGDVHQMGSDITAERMRFDFNFDRKLTVEELKKVEDIVNNAVTRKLAVEMREMPYDEAVKAGALSYFKEKYPPMVKVYSIGDFKADPPEIFSRELCGGPHVKNTSDIEGFHIIKEEAVGAGVRRIRAKLRV